MTMHQDSSRGTSSQGHRDFGVRWPCFIVTLLLIMFCVTTQSSAQSPPDEIKLEFVAVMEQREGQLRLVGVKPSAATLNQIELNPGDFIEFEVVQIPVVSERWQQEFHWDVERKEGKDKIIEQTTQSSLKVISLHWGVSIAPKFKLGNAEIDVAKPGRQKIQTQQSFKGKKGEIPSSGVTFRKQPVIPRPPAAPANATGGKDIKFETLDLNRKPVVHDGVVPGCTLNIRIIRAAASK